MVTLQVVGTAGGPWPDNSRTKRQLACGTRRTVYRGVAYDLGPYITRHPGGEMLLRLALHRDCTALVESYHMRTGVAVAHLKRLPVIEGFPVNAVRRWARAGAHGSAAAAWLQSKSMNAFVRALAGRPIQTTARSMSPSGTACAQRCSRAARCDVPSED